MALNTRQRQHVDYFTGLEVENMPLKNQPTLFVVGVKPYDEIVAIAENQNIKNIYLGTSQSFTPITNADWSGWDTMITNLLIRNFSVTLDFDVCYAERLTSFTWLTNDRFIAMVSVKIPNIDKFNVNTTIKLDDKTWGYSNTGVWCHRLTNLMQVDAYTDWSAYRNDEKIK